MNQQSTAPTPDLRAALEKLEKAAAAAMSSPMFYVGNWKKSAALTNAVSLARAALAAEPRGSSGVVVKGAELSLVLAFIGRHGSHELRVVEPEYEPGAVICDDCPEGDNHLPLTASQEFDHAVEDVHRAFCEPDHELVGEWDRSMAEALRRRGLVIAPTPPPADESAEGLRDDLLADMAEMKYGHLPVIARRLDAIIAAARKEGPRE